MAKKAEPAHKSLTAAPAGKTEPARKPNVAVRARSHGQTFVWVVLILIILGLGGYGTVQFGGTLRTIGKVGDTDIPVSRYQRQLNLDLQQIRQQFGLQLSMEQARAFGLDRQSLARVVNQVALENEAQRMGLSVGDAEVQQRLMQIPSFRNFNGGFDPEIYREVLRRSGISVAEFEGELRANAARTLLMGAVQEGVAMPGSMADTIYRWAAERRSFVWAELSESDLATPVPAATDADLKAWYDAHPEPYTLPETRRITYAWITPSMLVDQIDVDEAELHKLYDSRAAEYNQPARRLVERLVFGTAAEAEAAWDRLQKGETDFDSLVKERGLTLDDVNLDEVTEAQLGAAGPTVFALTEPGLAGPAETDLGPAIFRVNAILEAQVTPYEAVRDDLKRDYALDRAARMITDMSEQVADLLAGGATLEELAGETDLELGHVDWTPEVSDGIAGYAAFRTAAAEARTDDFPEVVALDDGGIFALRLDEIVAPKLQPMDAVIDRVREDWRRDAVNRALEGLADELIPRIEAGEDPASFGLAVNRVDVVTRDTTLEDTPEGLVAKAFELAPGKAARIPGIEGTATVALVSTTEVLPPDPEDADMEAKRAQLADQLTQQLRSDLQEAFTAAVAAAAGVRIDQPAVDAVNASIN